MSEENKTDKKNKKKESATKEFAGVVDVTSEFLKKIFPFAYVLVDKLRSKQKKGQEKAE